MGYTTILSLFIISLLINDIACGGVKNKPKRPLPNQQKQGLNLQQLTLKVESIMSNDMSIRHVTRDSAKETCRTILSKTKMIGMGCTSKIDPNGHYNDENDCVNHFMNVYPTTPMGDIVSNGNTSTCRIFHTVVAMIAVKEIKNFDPATYCGFVGKTGGDKCVDDDEIFHGHVLTKSKKTVDSHLDKLQKENVDDVEYVFGAQFKTLTKEKVDSHLDKLQEENVDL